MKRKLPVKAILSLVLLFCAVVLLCSGLGLKRSSPTPENITHITKAEIRINGGTAQETELPCVLKQLPPNATVSLTASFFPKADDGVFIQSDYVPAKIYFDGRLQFQMGTMDNYPRFMRLPGKEIHVVEAFGDGSEKQLQVEFSTAKGGRLTLHRPMVGTAKELLMERGQNGGVPMILALGQILAGIALMAVALCIAVVDKKGLLFFWLGLFAMLSGIWFFGSNDTVLTILPYTAFLYLSSFTALLLLPVALLQFIEASIEFEKPCFLRCMEGFFCLSGLAQLLLQFAGLVPLHKSAAGSFLLSTAGLLLLDAMVVWEYHRTRNIDAKRFILPISMLSAACFSGFIGYVFFPFQTIFPLLHQIGNLLVLLFIAVLVGIYVKDSLDLQRQMTMLSHEKELLKIRTDEQAKASMQLVENEELLHRQRHDLRHHIAVIEEYANQPDKLKTYLAALSAQIPKARQSFCENSAVNAVVSHFASLCEQNEIALTVKINVPQTGRQDLDSKLCVVYANLLENGVEACVRMQSTRRFIRIHSTMQYHILTVTMDNSFEGSLRKVGDRFRSAKRDDFGVGLTSVQAIAQEYQGDAEFHGEDGVFYSSVYLKL